MYAQVFIETTRPELLAACVALVAHPDDKRYAPLFGKTVRSPLFDVEVGVYPHPLAQPDKGSGIAMICTTPFADNPEQSARRVASIAAALVVSGCIVAAIGENPFDALRAKILFTEGAHKHELAKPEVRAQARAGIGCGGRCHWLRHS